MQNLLKQTTSIVDASQLITNIDTRIHLTKPVVKIFARLLILKPDFETLPDLPMEVFEKSFMGILESQKSDYESLMIKVLKEMKRQGHLPTRQVYSNVMDVFRNFKDGYSALLWNEEFIKMGILTEENVQKVDFFNRFSFEKLIKREIENGDLAQALYYLDQLHGRNCYLSLANIRKLFGIAKES